jgi:hypothetical protein
MIYALHLLERLKTNGRDFIFKGGTSLVLLSEEDSRFSIDIDIICKTGRTLYAFTGKYPNTWIYATGSTKSRARLYRMGITKIFAFPLVPYPTHSS